MISIDQFHEIEMRIGKILSAEKIPDTDKLLKLSVDFGFKPVAEVPSEPALGEPGLQPSEAEDSPKQEKDIRQIVSGISAYFPDPQGLVGKHVAFVANLEPRTLRGLESQGMILGVHENEAFALMEVPDSIPPGTRVG